MLKKCDICVYKDECWRYSDDEDCDDFVPQSEEEYYDYLIEEGRYEFRGEWFEYVSQYND